MPSGQIRRRVAVAVTDPASFEGEMVRGVMDYHDLDHHWRFVGDYGRPFVSFDRLDLRGVDGVIGPFYERRWAEAVANAGIPAVAVTYEYPDLPLARVLVDHAEGGRMGAEHLLARGFAQFGYIKQGRTLHSESQLEAFRRVVEDEAGRPCHVTTGSARRDAVDAGDLRRWVAELPKPIGIMASNDVLGREAVNAAVELGLNVPGDVAVLGGHNEAWTLALAEVPVSSVEHDWRQVGRRAAQALDGLMNGEAIPPTRWIPPTGVVTRRSTDIVVADDPVVTKALGFIRDHSADGIDVDDVLDAVGLSRKSLETRMKRAIGQTPHVAICRARVRRARKMLLETDWTMDRIARACGFRWQSQLNIVFKRLTGQTPGEFRRSRSIR